MPATTTALGSAPSVPISPIPAVNVATVPQRSPLRYPGGKTWLIPHIRAWLGGIAHAPELLIEPFAGGGIVSLTAVMEGLVERCLMVELDREVAAFWKATLHHNGELIAKIRLFDPTRRTIEHLTQRIPQTVVDHGFRTLVLNRTRRGGILANGAALNRSGENGKGVASRWYPDTIVQRLEAIERQASRIDFCETDGLDLLDEYLSSNPESRAVVFADPPYTAGGKRAGRRLYDHNDIDHTRLLAILAGSGVDFLMTYDESREILALIEKHEFHAVRVVMKNTHHVHREELVITPRPLLPLSTAAKLEKSSQ